MKFSSQEEYGLRCLLSVARAEGSVTIPEISRLEGLTEAYVGKLLMVLRKEGFITSTRGQSGGYTLSRDPDQIHLADVLAALGGRLFEDDFCAKHAGLTGQCTHEGDCSVRWLWTKVQDAVDNVLSGVTLRDILGGGERLIQVQVGKVLR